MKFYQVLLFPFSLLYGVVMAVRNWLFSCGCLPSREFDTPIVVIGNLSYGGTGKTPHIEYLIRLLHERFLVATLSRGYGRSSKGFVLASKRSAYKYVGDEPLQFAKKYDDIKVAIDEDRVEGIEILEQKFPKLDVILLDDAFQHRHVKPGLSLLLTDFHKLYTDDSVLPSGTLREFPCGSKRADIIIVTKTPKIFSPITRRRIIGELKPRYNQEIFFSYIRYDEPVIVTPSSTSVSPYSSSMILLFSGIANDYPLREHLRRHCRELEVMQFPDHHPYTMDDLKKIKNKFDDFPTKKKVIFTTEKDIMRIKTPELSNFVKRLPLFYLPITVEFHGDEKAKFDQTILNYVEKNTRNY
ncbi:MAG: tetraacyldisaccharide 4'-kinase [Bacteroidales bacterium]|nr:tetraacyldisaccharide 4'-kinase [Bacteroidales bacterium]